MVDQLPPQGSSCLLSGAAGDRPPPALAPRAPAYFRTCPSDALYAEDYNLQELCELQQHQFLLACRIQDSECGGGNDPLLPDLRTSLASVTEALLLVQQQQQQRRQPLQYGANFCHCCCCHHVAAAAVARPGVHLPGCSICWLRQQCQD